MKESTYLCRDWTSMATFVAACTTADVIVAAMLGTKPAIAAAKLITSKTGEA